MTAATQAKPDIKRWSDEKLERELCFGRAAFNEKCPHNVSWMDRLNAETERRLTLPRFTGLPR